jgi:transposase
MTGSVDAGLLAIDTNVAEDAIGRFALGRRNCLFAATAKGARGSAVLYSIVSTARVNGLEAAESHQSRVRGSP